MTGKTAAEIQRDEQWSATPELAARVASESLRREIHTAMPGIVKSFDATTQTCVVQPALQRVFVGVDDPVTLPLCVDVPVVFPAGGDFVMTFPVSGGDECLLVFAERAIDFWWDRGDVQLPAEVRFHDLSDGFAIMGVSNRKRAQLMAPVATDAAELRNRAGDTVLRIEDGTIYVGGKAGSELALKAETYRSAETTLNASWQTFLAAMTAYVTATAIPPPPAPPPPATATMLAAITALESAVASFEGGAAAYLAQQAKVL